MQDSCMQNYMRDKCDMWDKKMDNFPIAMAYVPWQYFHTVYDVDKALCYGTIFPELNKPFYGKRGVSR